MIIFICYRVIVEAITRILEAASGSHNRSSFKKNLLVTGRQKAFKKFFGTKLLKQSTFEELKRTIEAKLVRFKGDSRYGYWLKIFMPMQEDNQDVYEFLNEEIVCCFNKDPECLDFMG